MKLINRGIKPYMTTRPDYYSSTWQVCIPHEACIPLLQHNGEEAKALVKAGDEVREGQLIGMGQDGVGVHASIPGIIRELVRIELPNTKTCNAVNIKLAGQFDYTGKDMTNFDWDDLSPNQLIDIIRKKGIVQLDGSAENLAQVLENCRKHGIKTIVANAACGTPFLSSEVRILQEQTEKIAIAIQIIQHILGIRNAYFACTKHEFARELTRHAHELGLSIKTKRVREVYPAGSAYQLQFSRKKSQSSIPSAAVFNISTLLAVYEGVVLHKGLIDRIITVGGAAFGKCITIKARIGTSLQTIFQEVGGLQSEAAKIIVGLPLKGHEVKNINTPITKHITSVFALHKDEIGDSPQMPCVHCGECAEHCPAGLEPVILHKLLKGNQEEALERGLLSCWLCGICSHICPSHIPLTEIMQEGIINIQEKTKVEQYN